jgi:signal transduction histidine kinase
MSGQRRNIPASPHLTKFDMHNSLPSTESKHGAQASALHVADPNGYIAFIQSEQKLSSTPPVPPPLKVLVVDDNPVVLVGVSELLRTAGYEVLEARSGGEALQLARERVPDLILLDVMLPDMNGVEVCQKLKADPVLKTLFVVLLSATQISPPSQVSGLEAGADGYIARPIGNRELLARVQSLLRLQQAEAALRRAHGDLEARVEQRTAELAGANTALRAMSQRLVEVQEQERRFLARELHDEVGQVLTGLKMILDQSLPLSQPPLSGRLDEAIALVNDLVGRMRQLSLDLRPQMLDDLGLLVALDWHFRRYTQQTGIAVDFRHSPVPGRLPSHLETALYRIAQEALTNVARHARVKTVTVRLWVDETRAGIQIKDQGAGFDPVAALQARASCGLVGIRERAELLGGEFNVESSPGNGALLTVELPRPPGADAPT